MIKLQIDGKSFKFTQNKQRAREVAGPLPRTVDGIGLLNIDGTDYALIRVKGGWYYLARDGKWEAFHSPANEFMEALKRGK